MNLIQLKPAFDINIKKQKTTGYTPLNVESVSPGMGETLKVHGASITNLTLPDGYQPVEYITCNGTQVVWTDVEYTVARETVFIAKAKSEETESRTVLASWGAASGNWVGGVENWLIGSSVVSEALYTDKSKVMTTWYNDVETLSVNDVPVSGSVSVVSSSSYESRGLFRLFSNTRTTAGSFSGNFYIGKLIRQNEVLRCWLPCVHNSEVGLYELVKDEFIPINDAIAGPNIALSEVDRSILPERFFSLSNIRPINSASNFQILSNNTSICTIPVSLYGLNNVSDSFDLSTGELIQNFGILTLDGSETWTASGGGCYMSTGLNLVKPIDAFCNAAYYRKAAGTIATLTQNEWGFLGSPFNGNIAFKNEYTTSAANWKSFLATQSANGTPVTVIYSLPAPITSSVTPINITLEPNTNIITTSLPIDVKLDVTSYSTHGNDFTIGLHQGYIKPDGSMSTNADNDHYQYVTTDFIYGGKAFVFKPKDQYIVCNASLYDENGNLLKYNYLSPASPEIISLNYGKCFSDMLTKKYLLKLTIRSSIAGNIVKENEDIGEFFDYITSDKYHRASDSITTKKALYIRGRKRLTALTTLPVFLKKDPVYGQGLSSYNLGTIYTNPNASGGVIGQDCSKRTYMTAINNKHSVMYTECPVRQISGYGYVYPEGLIYSCKYFYGNVCTTIPSIFCNAPKGISENMWKALCTKIPVNNVQDMENIEPMDVLYEPGHVILILDKIYDNNGVVRFFEYCESGGGNYFTHITILTPEDLYECRIKDMEVYRDNGTSVVKDYENFEIDEPTPYLPSDYGSDYEEYHFNDDISPFLGDYSTYYITSPLPEDGRDILYNKVWLNIKGQNWNQVKLYKENILVQTFDITTIIDSDNEYWCDLNITSYFTSKTQSGNYTATAYDSVNDIESEPCHFEMLYADVSHRNNTAHVLNQNYGTSLNGCYCSIETSNNITKGKITWASHTGSAGEGNRNVVIIDENSRNEGVVFLAEKSAEGGSIRREAIKILFAGEYYNYAKQMFLLTTCITSSTNMLYTNISNRTTNSIIDTNGLISTNTNYCVSDFVPVASNTEYAYYFTKSANNTEALVVNEYDSNSSTATIISTKILISAADMNDSVNGVVKKVSFVTEPNTAYIRISMCNSDETKALCIY